MVSEAMREPTPTIRAELGRRRLTVGRLAAATEMSEPRLRRRLSDPDSFQLGELARVATALDLSTGDLLAGWLSNAAGVE